ncbi:hypothetical protein L7F22_048427 [Adiantum nelumboides]|nr:hypothetical protein [Adiantum nelumboides]
MKAPPSSAAAAASMIPGLPNDIAMLCLLKVPRIYHACLASVCVAWRTAVRHPDFYRQRRRLGIADAWLVIVSAEILSAPALLYSAYDLSTRQLLFKVRFPPIVKADAGVAAAPPPVAQLAPLNHLDNYRIVAMDELFAVLGFSRRSRFHSPRCSFTIFNTVTDEWRHGAPPSGCRQFFACGVISNRLYVVGGLNENGEIERATEVYNFATDTWTTAAPLPDAVSKVQADAVFQGKLYVQSVSGADVEGRPRSCFWTYYPQTDAWQFEDGLSGIQQLLATDKFLYAMAAQEELFRYEPADGKWSLVGCKVRSRRTARSDKLRTGAGAAYSFHSSQTLFGYGDDIFVLNDGTRRARLQSDGVTRCHYLFSVQPSWYHAGAVVSA